MLDVTLFQARGPLYLKDCLVIFNIQNFYFKSMLDFLIFVSKM